MFFIREEQCYLDTLWAELYFSANVFLKRQLWNNEQLQLGLLSQNTITSKKFIDFWDYFAKNFITGWTSLGVLTNFFNFSSPCPQMEKMLSIHLHLKHSLRFTTLTFSLYFCHKQSTIRRSKFHPYYHASFCFKPFSLKPKILCLDNNCAKYWDTN